MIFEACVGNYKEGKKAEELGANRIELCDNLDQGGTTPGYGTIFMAKQKINIPIMVIIRPRGGNFIYSKDEIEIMKKDIKICKDLGVYGVVLGVLNEDNTLNKERLKELVEESKPLKLTFHMAFDEIEDKFTALEDIIDLGFNRILTKGCSTNALDGKEKIKELIAKANNRILILPGGGLNKDNYKEFSLFTGAVEVHGTKIIGNLNN